MWYTKRFHDSVHIFGTCTTLITMKEDSLHTWQTLCLQSTNSLCWGFDAQINEVFVPIVSD